MYKNEHEICFNFLIYVRKIEVSIEVKSRFRLPWRRQRPFKVIKSHENKYDEIKKGILNVFKK